MESGSDTVVLTLPSTELNEDQSSDTIATSNVPADSVVSIHTDLLEAASDPLYGDEHSPLLCEVRVEQTQTTFNGTITSSLQEYWTTRYNRFVANTQFLGAARRHCRALRQGAQVPRSSYACEFNPRQHPLCAAIVQVSAEDDLNNFNWMKQGKVSIPQRLIAKVIRHTDQDLQEINTWLQRILRPWGRIGSSFPLHPRGDYDFASIVLAFILYKLDDATDAAMAIKSIIASRLLPARVTRPMLAVPRTAGSVLETENHLLMINGTFYLKALYDARQSPTGADGDNHSVAPDVQAFLLGFFTGILETGLWEYNSLPYLGYFMMALLIVYEAAPPSPLKDRAREVLDMLAYTYALGSLEFRRNAPFRRRLDYANRTHLRENALSNMMMVWAEKAGVCTFSLQESDMASTENTTASARLSTHLSDLPGVEKALYAIACSYCPDKAVLQCAFHKESAYFARIGHGLKSSPELFSAGPGWLLAAGGVAHPASHIVARPTTIMLEGDDALHVYDLFRLPGAGKKWKLWNNTGLFFNIAIGNGEPQVPTSCLGQRPVVCGYWAVYPTRHATIFIATYWHNGVGVLAVFDRTTDPIELATRLDELNGDLLPIGVFHLLCDGIVRCSFDEVDSFQYNSFAYNVNNPRHQWIITQVNGEQVDDAFYSWPHVDIHDDQHQLKHLYPVRIQHGCRRQVQLRQRPIFYVGVGVAIGLLCIAALLIIFLVFRHYLA
eukprot:m.90073 g.90073  ORF g.90073 m.90073 type:complete len:723 (+) comp14599_c0_seq7:126-2294(+)